jgi:hypothetical protein
VEDGTKCGSIDGVGVLAGLNEFPTSKGSITNYVAPLLIVQKLARTSVNTLYPKAV